MVKILSLLFLISLPLKAELLQVGQFELSESFYHSSATEFWNNAGESKNFSNKAKTTNISLITNISFGLPLELQGDFFFTYSKSKTDQDLAGEPKDNSFSGVDTLGFNLTHDLYYGRLIDLFLTIGFSKVLKDDTRDSIIALNDGADSFIIIMNANYHKNWIKLNSSLGFNKRFGDQPDQLIASLIYPLNYNRFNFGFGLGLTHTFAGKDFPNDIETNGVLGLSVPLSQLKERFYTLKYESDFSITEKITLGLNLEAKINGKNTDKGKSIVFDFAYLL